MSQAKKEFIYFFGKKFLKITKPDSVWWFAKINQKIAFGIAWAKTKGDYWYDKNPFDRGFIWVNKRELENLSIRELCIGRLMIGIASAKT